MAGEDKYLDYYVFWCYFILIIVDSVMTAMGYDDGTPNKLIALAVHGGVFWYWYKDKDYTFRWLLFGELSKLGIYVIIAFIFYSLNLNSIFENILM